MTKPPGKLLLVAAVLCGAALAQAAEPTDQTITSAAPAIARSGSPVPRALHLNPSPAPATHSVPRVNSAPRVKSLKSRTARRTGPGKVLYLTFDDGPQQVWTPKVLRILAKHQAKATFFVLGREAAAHPDLLTAIRRQGHTVGNHTWTHPMLTTVPEKRLRQEISAGVKSRCFRPPFRDTNPQVVAVAAGYGQRQVLWDIDTRDWTKPGAGRIEQAIVHGARPGAIVLMHDGGGDRSQTAKALDRALTKLTTKGYTFHALPC